MLNIENNTTTKMTVDDLIESASKEKKISEETRTKLKRGISIFKFTVIDKGNLITNDKDNSRVHYFYIKLKSKKYMNDILKFFMSLFGKDFPTIIEFHANELIYYGFNNGFLKNESLNNILNKQTYITSGLIKDEIDANKLINSSATNFFNDFIYVIVYKEVLKIDYPFKRFIPYNLLLSYNNINKLEKENKVIQNKLSRTHNNQRMIELNTLIKENRSKINSIKQEFKDKYETII